MINATQYQQDRVQVAPSKFHAGQVQMGIKRNCLPEIFLNLTIEESFELSETLNRIALDVEQGAKA